MNHFLVSVAAVASLILATRGARAQAPPAPVDEEAHVATEGWGLHTGDTAGRGENLFFFELGWPDEALGYLRGITDRLDLGIRISMPIGVDYTIPHGNLGVPSPGFE